MSPFHILCHLVPILMTRHHIIFLLPIWGNWGTERLWDLFQVPQLVSSRDGVPSNTGWSPNLCFQWAFFTLQCALRSPGDPVKKSGFDSADLGWGPRYCISTSSQMQLLLVHWADLSKNLEIINFLSILWDCLSTDFTDPCPAPFPPPATSWCSSVDLFTENDLFCKCQNISSPIHRCCWRTFCRFKNSVNIYEWMCGFPFFLINVILHSIYKDIFFF